MNTSVNKKNQISPASKAAGKAAGAAIKKAVAKKAPPISMSFGGAIHQAINAGNKIARTGWNGTGMFVIWVPGGKINLDPKSVYAKYFPKRKTMVIGGHLDMFTAQKVMQPGWLASQADMSSDDWIIV